MLEEQIQAWREADYESIWTPFDEKFRFRASTTKWPGFKEPPNSITYHIGHVYGDPERYKRLTLDLSRKLVSALRRCLKPHEFVYALDWQHPTYRFWPHAPFEYTSEDDWPVPALPNGDYYIFIDPGLTIGVLGHPWEQSMCVFGRRLLDAFKQDMPILFDQPIRVDGNVI